jgi:hypothetical protein
MPHLWYTGSRHFFGQLCAGPSTCQCAESQWAGSGPLSAVCWMQRAAGLVGAILKKLEVAMTKTVRAAPPNSLLFVSDPQGGMPPYPAEGEGVLGNELCVLIVCYPYQDGETTVTLGPAREVDPGNTPVYDGVLQTPNRALVVTTVDDETLLKEDVSGTTTRVRAWSNKPSMPDRIIIGFD